MTKVRLPAMLAGRMGTDDQPFVEIKYSKEMSSLTLLCTEIDTHTPESMAGPHTCEPFSERLYQRRPQPGRGTHNTPQSKTSSSEVLGFAFNVGKSAKSQITSLKKVTSLPSGNSSSIIHLEFSEAKPTSQCQTRMRGNFLKKHPPILSCHR